MGLKEKCPNCATSLAVPESMAGKSVLCPKCKKPFKTQAPIVGTIAEEPPPAPLVAKVPPVLSDPRAMIRSLASAVSIPLAESGNGLKVMLSLPEGRKQEVILLHVLEQETSTHTVFFFAPCQSFAKGLVTISPQMCLTLLRLNTTMHVGAFCLLELPGQEILGVKTDGILEAMQPEEFKRACEGVAKVADTFERIAAGRR